VVKVMAQVVMAQVVTTRQNNPPPITLINGD
jgi:hypothetical protein